MKNPNDLVKSISTNTHSLALSIKGIEVGFGDRLILENLDLDVQRGEILGFVGGSGQGKSILMRAVLELVPKRKGSIHILGQELDALSQEKKQNIQRKCGVLFQHGALFSSLTVLQNIQLPMREYAPWSQTLMNDLTFLKIEQVGLKSDAAYKYPYELSGGMIKRAALARALALDPELLFLDEPTSGLDPIGAAEFDLLILELKKNLNLTIFMVTHDLDSLFTSCDRVAALADRHIVAIGPLSEIVHNPHPWVQSYFHGLRGMRFLSK